MGAAAVPIVMAVAGAGLQAYNQRKTAKKQDREAYANLVKQRETQKQADASANKALTEIESGSAATHKETRSSQIRDQLRKSQSMALAGLQNSGGIDATELRALDAGGQAIDYGDFFGGNLAGLDAANMLRQDEHGSRLDLGMDLGRLGRNSAQDHNLSRMRMQGIRDNPWLTMLSSGLSAGAGAYGGGGLGGGKTMAGSALGGQSPQTFYGAMPMNQKFIPQQGGNIFSLLGP